jgi:Domain of unknown function (DUF4160)
VQGLHYNEPHCHYGHDHQDWHAHGRRHGDDHHVVDVKSSRTGNGEIMPPIQRFARCKITMYFNDDPPPHFHVIATSGEAKFRIDTLTEIVGEIDPRDTYEALEWAEQNRATLWDKWAELNEEET